MYKEVGDNRGMLLGKRGEHEAYDANVHEGSQLPLRE